MRSKLYKEVVQGFQDTKETAMRGFEYGYISLKWGFINFLQDNQFATAMCPQGKGRDESGLRSP
jgi:hypothetical protein